MYKAQYFRPRASENQGSDYLQSRQIARTTEIILSRKSFPLAPLVLSALVLAGPTGCQDTLWQLDPFSTQGRDGGGVSLDYGTLMRIAAAAHAAGDLPNAISLYRRAASIGTQTPAPLVAIGNTLVEMGQVDEAVVAYNGALALDPRNPGALLGIAKAYLKTARPELAGQPLSVAYEETPNDPKLLQLMGVAQDFLGQHGEAQARYRRGLELAPGDSALNLNLALSLALTGNYDEAIARLSPIALAPMGTPRERQSLALIYGLKGDGRSAEKLGLIDLEPSAVKHNLTYYETLRRLSPEARSKAIRALGISSTTRSSS